MAAASPPKNSASRGPNGTIKTKRYRSTQLPQAASRIVSPSVRDEDRRRSALALTVSAAACGLNGKEIAAIVERNKSTVSRWTDGLHDSPFSQVKPLLRQMASRGWLAIHVIADLLAVIWPHDAKSAAELEARLAALNLEEEEANHRVNLGQLRAGKITEDEYDAALLDQGARSLEIYAIRQELRRLRRAA